MWITWNFGSVWILILNNYFFGCSVCSRCLLWHFEHSNILYLTFFVQPYSFFFSNVINGSNTVFGRHKRQIQWHTTDKRTQTRITETLKLSSRHSSIHVLHQSKKGQSLKLICVPIYFWFDFYSMEVYHIYREKCLKKLCLMIRRCSISHYQHVWVSTNH